MKRIMALALLLLMTAVSASAGSIIIENEKTGIMYALYYPEYFVCESNFAHPLTGKTVGWKKLYQFSNDKLSLTFEGVVEAVPGCGENHDFSVGGWIFDLSEDKDITQPFRLDHTGVKGLYTLTLLRAAQEPLPSGRKAPDCAGHEGGQATCLTRARCIHCGMAYGELDAAAHLRIETVPASIPAANATLTEGLRCLDCGADIMPQELVLN